MLEERVVAATRPEKDYLAFLAEGRFMLQRSRTSGLYQFYPRVMALRTGKTDLEWVEASGGGTVYSTTVVRQRAPATDYNLALIDLDEGVRLMSRVEGMEPGKVRIGMRVKARVTADGASPMVVFDLDSEGAGL